MFNPFLTSEYGLVLRSRDSNLKTMFYFCRLLRDVLPSVVGNIVFSEELAFS